MIAMMLPSLSLNQGARFRNQLGGAINKVDDHMRHALNREKHSSPETGEGCGSQPAAA
jgi:hypothetical protein